MTLAAWGRLAVVPPYANNRLVLGNGGLPGVASAAGLDLIFQIGDRLSRHIMPAGDEHIARIYELRTLAPRPVIATLLRRDNRAGRGRTYRTDPRTKDAW
jgi:hypothetical protein